MTRCHVTIARNTVVRGGSTRGFTLIEKRPLPLSSMKRGLAWNRMLIAICSKASVLFLFLLFTLNKSYNDNEGETLPHSVSVAFIKERSLFLFKRRLQ